MRLKMILTSFIYLISVVSFVDAVENSVIPHMEKFEKIENLPVKRYSKRQLLEISSLLDQKNEKIRIVTYNILFNLYDHNLSEVNRWPQRVPRLVELIEEMQADILGVQELYPDQLDDILPHLNDRYDFYGLACEDGELNGIFYRKERFKVLESHVWYMTATPNVPSSETLTMLLLEDCTTGKPFAVFNTHLAFSKIDKREFQAEFIADKIKSFAKRVPVILTGDMNTFPHRLDLGKLPFYDGDHIQRILTRKHLKDAKEVSLLGHLGPMGTFTNATDDGIPFQGTGTPGVLLDHIYVSEQVAVLMHAVQPGTVNGHFPSDHLPVLMDCIIQR